MRQKYTTMFEHTWCLRITYSFRSTNSLSYVFIDPRNPRKTFCSGSEIQKYSSLCAPPSRPFFSVSLPLFRSLTYLLSRSLAPVDMSVTVNKQFFSSFTVCVCNTYYVWVFGYVCVCVPNGINILQTLTENSLRHLKHYVLKKCQNVMSYLYL